MKVDSTRRDFLRSAGIAVAGVASAAFARAQEQDKPKSEDEDPKKPKDQEPEDELVSEGSEEETRACPQCGALMYLDGDTWTCETCGYSYTE